MSWKKYGGINQLEKMNNITVNSIVTDTFTVRKFANEMKVAGIDVTGNVNINGFLFVALDICGNNLDISNNITLNGQFNLDKNNQVFFNAFTDSSNNFYLGLNKDNPEATLDISSNSIQSLHLSTDKIQNKNILARTRDDNGILFFVDQSQSSMYFYNSDDASGVSNINNVPGLSLDYFKNGKVLKIQQIEDAQILSKLIVSNRGVDTHIFDETAIIYDISQNTFNESVYNDNTIQYGNALSLISNDNSSNTIMNIATPNKTGLNLYGGANPSNLKKGMATLDVISEEFISNRNPALMVVDGNKKVQHPKTIGINTYKPEYDKYVLDMNGSMSLTNNNLKIISEPSLEIFNISYNKNNLNHSIASGSSFSSTSMDYKVLYTNDGGENWNLSNDISANFGTIPNFNFKYIYVLDNSNSFISNDKNDFSFYSNNGGQDYNLSPAGRGITNNKGIYIEPLLDSSFVNVYQANLNSISGFSFNFQDGSDNDLSNTIPDPNISNIISLDGHNSFIYVAGDDGTNGIIKRFDISNNIYDLSHNITNKKYKKIRVYNKDTAIALGDSLISFTTDGTTWKDISNVECSFNDVFILDSSRAIAVGDKSKMYFAKDGFDASWTLLDESYLNSSGLAFQALDTSSNISNVYMSDSDNITISSIKTKFKQTDPKNDGKTNLIKMFLPDTLNRTNNSNLDMFGNIDISGDIIFNDKGKIRSTDAEFNIVNESVKTINIGYESERLNIGGPNTKIFMNGTFDDNIDVTNLKVLNDTSLNNIYVSNDASFNSKVFVNQDVNFNSTLYVNSKTTLNETEIIDVLTVVNDVSLNSNINIFNGIINQF